MGGEDDGDNNIVVAVRVRPFNRREKGLKSKLCVKMNGKQTTVTDPENGKDKTFTFDYSYWSHAKDGQTDFATNESIFKDLGHTILDNAMQGYNTCLFAYGQTGAGKSYSMVGSEEDKGIIPLAMDDLFKRIEDNKQENIKYIVEASMLEIYNETVRDLLNMDKMKKHGLKIRDHPVLGPYVENLKREVVASYEEIENLMEEGTRARTVHSTKMNKTSSRAHTIFQIILTTQTYDEETKKRSNKTSKTSLVDLAGSERIDKTGATGDRLREGVNINKALSALGNVIKALCDRAQGKKNKHVPFRDSKLTWLLKQSLGGNSKTIMIAAISPAADNYDESVQTLRYANRAKQIKNKAKVNEDANAKLIRELKAEIQKLRQQVTGEVEEVKVEETKEYKEMKEKLQETEVLMKKMQDSFEIKLKRMESRKIKMDRAPSKFWTELCIVNLHADPALSEVLMYPFKPGITKVCRKDMQPPPSDNDIVLGGLQIQRDHADVLRDQDEITISAVQNSRVFVNGKPVLNPIRLRHNDCILFGAHHYYRFVDPTKRSPQDKRFDFTHAQKQIANSMFQIDKEEEEFKRRVQEEKKKKKELEQKLVSMEAEKQKILKSQAEVKKQMQQKLKIMEEKQEEELKKRMEQMKMEVDHMAKKRWNEELQKRTMKMQEERKKLLLEIERKEEEANKMSSQLEEAIKKDRLAKQRNERYLEQEGRNMKILRQKLIQMLPVVNEANAICNELKKKLFFTVRIVPKKTADKDAFTEAAEVLVEIVNLEDGKKSLWNHEILLEKMNDFQDSYEKHMLDQEEEEESKLKAKEDPFQFNNQAPQLLGSCRVYLEPLLFLMPIHVFTPILSYKGAPRGKLRVSIIPEITEECIEKVDHDGFEEQLPNIMGHPLKVSILISKALGIPKQFSREVFCEYKFHQEVSMTVTSVCQGATTNPVLKHSRDIIIDPVTTSFQKTAQEGALLINVYGSHPTGSELKDKKKLSMEAQLAIDEIGDIKDMLTSVLEKKLHKFPATQQLQELIGRFKASKTEVDQLNGMLADDKRNDMLLKVVAEKKELDKKYYEASHENEMLKAEKSQQANKLTAFKQQLEDADQMQIDFSKTKAELSDANRKLREKDKQIDKLKDQHVSKMNKLRQSGSSQKANELILQIENQKKEILRLNAELAESKGGGKKGCFG